MTKRFHSPTILLLTASSLLVRIAATTANPSRSAEAAVKPLRLADATMIVEVNATDGDAGPQVFIDGDPLENDGDLEPGRTEDPQGQRQGAPEGAWLDRAVLREQRTTIRPPPAEKVQSAISRREVHLRWKDRRGKEAAWQREALARHP
jgi:hypothetical protein